MILGNDNDGVLGKLLMHHRRTERSIARGAKSGIESGIGGRRRKTSKRMTKLILLP